MDITDLVETLRADLRRTAAVGGEETRAAGERLLLALEPSLRLTLMDVLSQAAAEISEVLPGIVVDVRLKGREPVFVVEGAPAAPPAADAFETFDDEAVARITLRLPEALKARAEILAAQRGQSLNTWLVTAARAAATDEPHAPGSGRHQASGRRIQGWAR